MASFLETVIERTRRDIAERKRDISSDALRATLEPPPRSRPFSEALIGEGISLVAEMKRSSPSRGAIRADASVAEVVRAYELAGARACSVLTEPHWFGGSLDDLRVARGAVSLPLLRKDFVVDAYQLLEARAAGADAALLIVAALDADDLARLLDAAGGLGLDCLVEVHDEEELAVALDCGADVIGINNRDLKTLEVHLDTTFRLLADIPAGTVVVAESGITTPSEVRELEAAGVDAILVGEALMRADDPAAVVRTLLSAR